MMMLMGFMKKVLNSCRGFLHINFRYERYIHILVSQTPPLSLSLSPQQYRVIQGSVMQILSVKFKFNLSNQNQIGLNVLNQIFSSSCHTQRFLNFMYA